MDVGAAMQNILLYAHMKGIGCCPIGGFAVETRKELLDIPEELEPVLFITGRYPDEKPNVIKRLPIDELVLRKVEK